MDDEFDLGVMCLIRTSELVECLSFDTFVKSCIENYNGI
jgi:hypothetical protein